MYRHFKNKQTIPKKENSKIMIGQNTSSKKMTSENLKKEIIEYKNEENKEYQESKIINLNVGGNIYSTTYGTLTQKIGYKTENYFTSLLNENFQIQKDEKGRIFIDRDGKYFRYILNFLRSSGDCKIKI
jgi:hypothetical protein